VESASDGIQQIPLEFAYELAIQLIITDIGRKPGQYPRGVIHGIIPRL
jgi:hypothetical protein